MYTFRTVAQKEREGPLSQNDFLSEMKQLQSEAAASPDISDKTAGFWKMESLGFTLVRHGESGATLNDPQFPTEARPIAHVGMGAGSVEGGQFVAEKNP